LLVQKEGLILLEKKQPIIQWRSPIFHMEQIDHVSVKQNSITDALIQEL